MDFSYAPIESFASRQNDAFQYAPLSVADIIVKALSRILAADSQPTYGDLFGAVTGGYIGSSSQLIRGHHVEADL